MTLDQRIQKDLTELYNGGATPGVIQDAFALDGLIQAKPGQTSFATKALPQYYTGDRKAKTVLVMLNPGEDVDTANNNLRCDILKHSMQDAKDVNSYHKWCANYGHIDRLRLDNFDLKQAFFLHKWPSAGITFPASFCPNPKCDDAILREAKEAVLTQKLQLELIPYASSTFGSFVNSKISLAFPFVETLFEEIFSHDRRYVIFCSRKFERVFKEYSKKHPNTIDFIRTVSQQIPGSKIKGSCTVINIKQNGKPIRAIIANTFPNQALPNAYEKMEKYGEYCYNVIQSKP